MFLHKNSHPRGDKKVIIRNCGICGQVVKTVVPMNYPEDLIRRMATPVCKACKKDLGTR